MGVYLEAWLVWCLSEEATPHRFLLADSWKAWQNCCKYSNWNRHKPWVPPKPISNITCRMESWSWAMAAFGVVKLPNYHKLPNNIRYPETTCHMRNGETFCDVRNLESKKFIIPTLPHELLALFPAKSRSDWHLWSIFQRTGLRLRKTPIINPHSRVGVFFSRAIHQFGCLGTNKTYLNNNTVGGRNPLCTRFYASQVVQDFFHQQYHPSQD